jgi:hypothetical protein
VLFVRRLRVPGRSSRRQSPATRHRRILCGRAASAQLHGRSVARYVREARGRNDRAAPTSFECSDVSAFSSLDWSTSMVDRPLRDDPRRICSHSRAPRFDRHRPRFRSGPRRSDREARGRCDRAAPASATRRRVRDALPPSLPPSLSLFLPPSPPPLYRDASATPCGVTRPRRHGDALAKPPVPRPVAALSLHSVLGAAPGPRSAARRAECGLSPRGRGRGGQGGGTALRRSD